MAVVEANLAVTPGQQADDLAVKGDVAADRESVLIRCLEAAGGFLA